MSKNTVDLDTVMEQLQTITAQQMELKAMISEIKGSNKPKRTVERPYNAKQIRDLLIGAGIMEQNQVTKNEGLLNILEAQVSVLGNDSFMEVVSNVASRIAQGGVKNRLGYFRSSMNKALGK